MQKLERLLEWGGIKRISSCSFYRACLCPSASFIWFRCPLTRLGSPFFYVGCPSYWRLSSDWSRPLISRRMYWSPLALIASVLIGEDFAAGEVAFIMQLGALLEDLTVAKAQAGIEKLVRLTPQTARILNGDREKSCPPNRSKSATFSVCCREKPSPWTA